MASEAGLVSVFKTDDPGILPLAKMALEAEGIEYFIKSAGKADTLDWARSQKPTNRPEVLEIFVVPDVASKARDLLVDLEQLEEMPSAPTSPGTELWPENVAREDAPAIMLENAATGLKLGTLTEEQLQEITSRAEEGEPQTYTITDETIDDLQKTDVDAALVDLLRQAVDAGGGSVVVRWFVR